MAKVGFWLQGARGKLAGSSLKGQPGGATVMAKVNATPANPNTAAQQGVRSSFKLISQLASQLANIIAIPREGAKSSRNIFTSINYPKVFANEAGAGIILEDVQLTKSNIKLPNISVSRSQGRDEVEVSCISAIDNFVDKMVWIVIRNNNGNLQKIDEYIVDTQEHDNGYHKFVGNEDTYEGNLIVYGYGLKLENEAARVKYANMGISTADEVAQVVINRTFSSSEAGVTKTSGTELGTNESSGGAEDNKHLLTINKGGLKGSVSGGGNYAVGANVTLQFTPADSKQHFTAFAEEDENGGATIISSNNPATYKMPARNVNVVVRGYTTNA